MNCHPARRADSSAAVLDTGLDEDEENLDRAQDQFEFTKSKKYHTTQSQQLPPIPLEPPEKHLRILHWNCPWTEGHPETMGD